MHNKESGFSICKNSDLIEELGQIELVFSDKTGTLTCNNMEYKKSSVNGIIYDSYDQVKKSKDSMKLDKYFTVLSVCHTVFIDKDNIKLQASSPDELALV